MEQTKQNAIEMNEIGERRMDGWMNEDGVRQVDSNRDDVFAGIASLYFVQCLLFGGSK